MPIKPENAKRYPKDWKAIRSSVLRRAGDRCEGSPAFPDCRAVNGEEHPETGSHVVLTIGHLDQTPEHCEMDNLRAWCQRCHLNYDAKQHARSSCETRRANRRTLELF